VSPYAAQPHPDALRSPGCTGIGRFSLALVGEVKTVPASRAQSDVEDRNAALASGHRTDELGSRTAIMARGPGN
jgi:hypothetical protein